VPSLLIELDQLAASVACWFRFDLLSHRKTTRAGAKWFTKLISLSQFR
jgi:hypothetical protein